MATKRTSVQDIFFAATCGMRTLDNFADAQMLMDEIASNNYKWAIDSWLEDYQSGKKSAEKVLNEMVEQTIRNLCDRNGHPTTRSWKVEVAYSYHFRRR